MIHISLIEDDATISKNLEVFIGFFDDLQLVSNHDSVESFIQAAAISKITSAVLLLDIGLPGMSGLEGIPAIKSLYPDLDIIMLTTFEDEEKIVAALQSGACSYLSKKTALKDIMETIRLVHDGGSYMSPSIARKLTTYFAKGGSTKEKYHLSPKQVQVIQGLVDGLSYKALAEQLDVSVSTVKTHIKRIYEELHVQNKAGAVAKYLQR